MHRISTILETDLCLCTEYSTSENDTDENNDADDNDDNGSVSRVQKSDSTNSLINWLVTFLCMWQSVFNIPDNAIQALIKFLSVFIKVLTTIFSLIQGVISGMPSSLYKFHKYLQVTNEYAFVHYVVCPSCYSIYVTGSAKTLHVVFLYMFRKTVVSS